jgi:hypothetical protein
MAERVGACVGQRTETLVVGCEHPPMLTEPQTRTRDTATGDISIRSACDALATAIAAMTICNASAPSRAGPRSDTGPPRITRPAGGLSNLEMLKMRLAIFLYGHPVANMRHVVDAIDNAQTMGEVKVLLDYILTNRGHALAAISNQQEL